MSEQTPFSGYALVEVMGHNKYAGYVSEAILAGQPVLQVDVPAVPATPYRDATEAFVKFLAIGSLYAMTPLSESEAMRLIPAIGAKPHNVYVPTERRLLPAYDDSTEDDEHAWENTRYAIEREGVSGDSVEDTDDYMSDAEMMEDDPDHDRLTDEEVEDLRRRM